MKAMTIPAAAVILLAGSAAVFWPKGTAAPVADETIPKTRRPPVVTRTADVPAKSAPRVTASSVRAVASPPAAPVIPKPSDLDPALKEAFQNDPRTKAAEAKINVLKKGYKRMLDEKSGEYNALTQRRDEAAKKAADLSLSPAERDRARTLSVELSAGVEEKMAAMEQIRVTAEAWLGNEVSVMRATILGEIKNGVAPPPDTIAPAEGIVVDTGAMARLKEGDTLLEAADYPAALGVYKALAGESTGAMKATAWWNAMLCGMITENGAETDGASDKLVREASPGAACFAQAAQAIRRGEWDEARLWVLQAAESGEPSENHFFKESLVRLGWMDPATGFLLEPTPGE